MAGPIQKAISDAVSTVSVASVVGKKLSESERQAREKATAEAKAEEDASTALQEEAKNTAIEADLIKMGADPKTVKAFMDARSLGLDTKSFGMIRKKGKFVGSYSLLAEQLSKGSLADSLTARVLSDKGFSDRILALGGTRRGRVDALVKATEGGKK